MAVTFNGTNVTLAESGDSGNWDDDESGPGSSQSGDLPIQGTEARGRRVDASDKGFSFDEGTGVDLSALGTHVGWWVVALQPGQVTRGSVKLGGGIDAETSPNARYDRFDGTNAYPPVGGWQRVYVDVYRVPDVETGTIDRTSIRQFGIKFDMGDVGGNAPNVQQDRTDYLDGGGIYLTVDGSSQSIQDVVTADPENSSNVYGCVTTLDGVIYMHARLGIGDATATTYADDAETIVFSDQILAAKDWLGITVDLQNASTVVSMDNGIVQSAPGGTRQGDLKVLDITSSGTFDTTGQVFRSLRRLGLNSKCTLATTTIDACGQIDPTNADYTGEMDLPATDEYVDTQENLDLSSASGDFEIIMRVAADDWTPGSTMALASHYGGTVATESFRLQLLTTTVLRLIVSDGATETTLDSNALVVEDTEWRWIRVTYDQSAGQANFYESSDPADTPSGDIEWTARGTPSGTSRSIPSLTRIMLLGAENDGTPASFFSGKIAYAELWTDGFRATGASHGDLIFRADWRTGPDFTGSPATRSDDFDTVGITWEEQGTAPVYTQGDDNGATAADLSTSTVSNSSSESALLWNANTNPNGELDDMAFTSSGTGHAMEFGPNTPAAVTLTGHSYTGYAGSDGSTGNEVIYNNSGKALTITVTGDTPTIRNGTGASTTVVTSPVTTTITVRDETGALFQNVLVLVEAGDGTGDLPFEETVTITRSGATATVSHTAHGLDNGDKVAIRGANLEVEYRGVHSITNVSTNAYDYTVSGSPDTPAATPINSTGVVVSGLTNASGIVTASRAFSVDQNVRGKARKSTSTPRYKSNDFTDVVDNANGLAKSITMVRDD